MNVNKCTGCGGGLLPSDITCKYCGTPVEVEGPLRPQDKKRMVSVAKIMSRSLDRNAVDSEYGDNRTYVYVNIVLTTLLAWLLYAFSTWVVAASVALLLTALVFAVYSEEYWFILETESERRIYEKSIKPAIESFLKSYNYFGAHWREVVTELLDEYVITDGRDFFRKEYSLDADKENIYASLPGMFDSVLDGLFEGHEEFRKEFSVEPEKMGAKTVLIRAAETLGEYAHTAMTKRKARYYLYAGYTVALLALLFCLFFDNCWISLLWTVPPLLLLILLALDVLRRFSLDLDYKYDPRLLTKRIIPMLESYCKETGMDFSDLVIISRKFNLIELHEWLKRYSNSG